MKARFLLTLLFGAFYSPFTQASDYGCQVLLCLSNPSGPKAVAECVPPIDRLYKDLAKGRSFPSCEMANDSSGSSYAQPGFSYYNPCPENTAELTQGILAMLSNEKNRFYIGIGNGDQVRINRDTGMYYDTLPKKICVGNKIGQTKIKVGVDEDGDPIIKNVTIYDQLVVLDPQNSPRIIDVYIDKKLFRRVRW